MFRDCRAALSHARGQPSRHTATVQWQVGSSGALHETIIVRVKTELKEGGAGLGNKLETQTRKDSEPAMPAPFVLCKSAIPRALRPFHGGLRGSRLCFTVILYVGLRRFRCVVCGVMVMTVGQLCVVCSRLVFACFVVSGRFFVVPCCVFIMFCRFMMMLCCLL